MAKKPKKNRFLGSNGKQLSYPKENLNINEEETDMSMDNMNEEQVKAMADEALKDVVEEVKKTAKTDEERKMIDEAYEAAKKELGMSANKSSDLVNIGDAKKGWGAVILSGVVGGLVTGGYDVATGDVSKERLIGTGLATVTAAGIQFGLEKIFSEKMNDARLRYGSAVVVGGSVGGGYRYAVSHFQKDNEDTSMDSPEASMIAATCANLVW